MEQEGRRTGSERCPGEADCQERSSRGRRAPTCLACGIGKVPGPARGPRDDAPPLSPRRNPPNLAPFTTTPKKAGKKVPPTPTPAERRLGLAGVCSPGPARLRDPPGYAGSSPVPGAAESRTSVTWIFTRQEGATPAFPARSDWNPRSPLARAPRQVCCPVTHSSPRRSPARFPERLGEPSRREFFWLLEGAAGEEPRRWMLLSCAAHASCERSAPGRAESPEDCPPQPEGGRGERSCPAAAAGAEEAAVRAMPRRPPRRG